MRNLMIIGMLLVGAFMAGWFQINREGDRTTIEINRNEIRNDTQSALQRGREFLDRQEQFSNSDPSVFDQQGQAQWPEQVASQADQWGNIQQQSYNQEAYQRQPYDANYGSQYQQVPQQQPYYPPTNR